MKKILLLSILALCMQSPNAMGGGIFKSDDASDIEFPEPEDGDAPDRRTTSGNQTGPIGTATLLLLGLGGAAVGYKVAKNSKNQKEEDK